LRRWYLLAVLLAAVVVLSGCSAFYTQETRETMFQAWCAMQPAPQIAVVALPATTSNPVLEIVATAPEGTELTLAGDGGGGPIPETPLINGKTYQLRREDGVQLLVVFAERQYYPEDTYLQGCGECWKSSLVEIPPILVDTTPPKIASLSAIPSEDSQRVLVRGHVHDVGVGTDRVGLSGYYGTETPPKPNGYFEIRLPYNLLEGPEVQVWSKDSLGNRSISAWLEVPLPTNGWVEEDLNSGMVLGFNTSPTFEPQKGLLGWGSSRWLRLESGRVVEDLYTEPAHYERVLVGGVAGLVLLILAVLVGPPLITYFQVQRFVRRLRANAVKMASRALPAPETALQRKEEVV